MLTALAWYGAYWLSYNLNAPPKHELTKATLFLPLVLFTQVTLLWITGTHRSVWRFISIRDIFRIIKATVITTLFISGLGFFYSNVGMFIPRSIPILFCLLSIAVLCSYRVIYRWIYDQQVRFSPSKRVLIIGAGGGAEILIRSLQRHNKEGYLIIGLLDDDTAKLGQEIHGVRVLGKISKLNFIAKKYHAELILIAIPLANTQEMRRIVNCCEETELPYRTLPSINDIASGRANITNIREVRLEDLLSRDPIKLDWKTLGENINGKIIMVTGGGGSIGSELCRQIARLSPTKLIIIEHSEFNLYRIQTELQQKIPELNLLSCLTDITNQKEIANIIHKEKPNIVFHAAAYKHVPLLESQIYTSIHNNVIGTKILAEESISANVNKFVLISTDKAVKPTSIMGATKRCAEIFCYNLSQQHQTEFITVRFGNVLGSTGSVVPLFHKQIMKGGPVTVTHPEITRYFMTTSEACQLIMQAASIGKGGELFVLDMGEPIKIKYLAEQMIKLAGLSPEKDIKITYTGLRPGEKLYEELSYETEKLLSVKNKKLLRGNMAFPNIQNFLKSMQILEKGHPNKAMLQKVVFSMIQYTSLSIDNNQKVVVFS